MGLLSLGYVGVQSAQLEDWSSFATGLLGMQAVDTARKMRTFRMDDRKQRLMVTAGESESLGFLGWEVANDSALNDFAARLEDRGVAVHWGGRALSEKRQVRDLVQFRDPAGNLLEAFHGPSIAADPFRSGRPISGFVTGPMGMGHVVLNVVDVELLLPFYRDVLGFQVTDYGLTPYKLYFFHLNGRHHSFAMVGSGRSSLHHFMVELGSLDDVGQGYDLASLEDDRIAYTLGRHTNDWMTSFYANSPSGFFVEYGWGARVIDPETWQPHETFDGPSFWGHERLYMEPEQRKRLRDMRLDAAARGVRAELDAANCRWLDAVIFPRVKAPATIDGDPLERAGAHICATLDFLDGGVGLIAACSTIAARRTLQDVPQRHRPPQRPPPRDKTVEAIKAFIRGSDWEPTVMGSLNQGS